MQTLVVEKRKDAPSSTRCDTGSQPFTAVRPVLLVSHICLSPCKCKSSLEVHRRQRWRRKPICSETTLPSTTRPKTRPSPSPRGRFSLELKASLSLTAHNPEKVWMSLGGAGREGLIWQWARRKLASPYAWKTETRAAPSRTTMVSS